MSSKALNQINAHISQSIDLLRAVAALGVIWGHSIYGVGLGVELNGAFWVWVFLPVSGYLVAQSFLTQRYRTNLTGFISFLINRVLRLLPLAYVAMVLAYTMYFFSGSLANLNAPILDFVFFQEKNNMQLLGPLWTVATELHFYFTVFLILPLYLIKDKLSSALCCLILFPICGMLVSEYIAANEPAIIQPRTLVGNLPFFIWGIILALLHDYRVRLSNANAIKCALLVLISLFAAYIYNSYPTLFWGFGLQNSYGAHLALLLVTTFLLIDEKKPTDQIDALPILVFVSVEIGKKCYGIYVWHAVLLLYSKLFLGLTGFALCLFLLLSVPLAFVSHRFFESKFLKFKAA